MKAARLSSAEEEVGKQQDLAHLRARAAQCRRLGAGVGDRQTAATLRAMAEDYEEQARRIEQPD